MSVLRRQTRRRTGQREHGSAHRRHADQNCARPSRCDRRPALPHSGNIPSQLYRKSRRRGGQMWLPLGKTSGIIDPNPPDGTSCPRLNGFGRFAPRHAFAWEVVPVADSYDEDDLFKHTSMTFGEHLEELRSSLFKAVISLAIGFGIGLYFAPTIVQLDPVAPGECPEDVLHAGSRRIHRHPRAARAAGQPDDPQAGHGRRADPAGSVRLAQPDARRAEEVLSRQVRLGRAAGTQEAGIRGGGRRPGRGRSQRGGRKGSGGRTRRSAGHRQATAHPTVRLAPAVGRRSLEAARR